MMLQGGMYIDQERTATPFHTPRCFLCLLPAHDSPMFIKIWHDKMPKIMCAVCKARAEKEGCKVVTYAEGKNNEG